MSKNHFKFFFKRKRKSTEIKEEKMLSSQFSNIRRTQFDQSSPVHPVSESSGGYRERYNERGTKDKRTNKGKSSCLILDYHLSLSLSQPIKDIIPNGEPSSTSKPNQTLSVYTDLVSGVKFTIFWLNSGQRVYLADPGETRGCSINSLVIN